MKALSRRKVLAGFAVAGASKLPAAPTVERLRAGKSTVEVTIAEGALDIGRPAVMEWVTKAVRAVESYYGRFPVPEAHVQVQPVEGRNSVFSGVTFGRVPALTQISVGSLITQEGLDSDWVMCHELVHLAFPSVPRRHHWMEEGLSTYIEPLARLHLKQISEDAFWRDMIRDMPQGLPKDGDRGMDNTHTWGRTYWGGAIYCLQAEIAIRERTGGKRGLQHALRGILDRVGSIQEDVELEPVLAAGDKATGTTVMMELYGQMKDEPMPMDLPGMWKLLGVSWVGGRVSYNDKAKLAGVRRAIVSPLA